jgi:hypothetical protein
MASAVVPKSMKAVKVHSVHEMRSQRSQKKTHMLSAQCVAVEFSSLKASRVDVHATGICDR